MGVEHTILVCVQDAMRWALQIAEALAYLHHFSPLVVHRDLKLENILLTSPNPATADAKLADFGLHKCIKVPGPHLVHLVWAAMPLCMP